MSGSRAWAVVPSNGRPMLDDLIASLVDQVYDVIVVANNWDRPEPPDALETLGLPVQVVDGGDERNISRWWNRGLDMAAQHAGWRGDTEFDVLVVNDDVICPSGLVETLGGRMRGRGAAMAYPDQAGGQQEILHTQAGPVPLSQRITGYAFLLRGEAGLRADESMAWWFSDDSLDWEARERGGSLLVPGVPVQHRAPDVQTNARPELQEQACRDRETFISRWGKAPW
ncbi:NTP transferase domain-containing protein [Streptomyces canus]|uniref:glycosyltransferase family 2 protein n=1 Tax=Streptomyces canus TaxID=58343 RepID=UPI00224DBD8E|nr:NTP transferase domain-containing protein [Streptomyces canus]MCX5253647.1 NTP transferase domain-containing protein [Streptomyces canus]